VTLYPNHTVIFSPHLLYCPAPLRDPHPNPARVARASIPRQQPNMQATPPQRQHNAIGMRHHPGRALHLLDSSPPLTAIPEYSHPVFWIPSSTANFWRPPQPNEFFLALATQYSRPAALFAASSDLAPPASAIRALPQCIFCVANLRPRTLDSSPPPELPPPDRLLARVPHALTRFSSENRTPHRHPEHSVDPPNLPNPLDNKRQTPCVCCRAIRARNTATPVPTFDLPFTYPRPLPRQDTPPPGHDPRPPPRMQPTCNYPMAPST